jgi:hypothetical protein
MPAITSILSTTFSISIQALRDLLVKAREGVAVRPLVDAG